MHQQVAFQPVDPSKLTPTERKKAMHSLIFLQEKNSNEVKARTCADSWKQRIYSNKEDNKSPTAATESIMLTAVIEAKEERDVATIDIPNAFIQTSVDHKPGDERIILKAC